MKQETIQHTESSMERREEESEEVFKGPQICVSTVEVGGPYFYFESLKELSRKLKKLPPGYKEFELDFYSGTTLEKELFDAMQVDLANIDDYYESLEEESEEDTIKFVAASRLSQYSNLETVSDAHSFTELYVHEGRLDEMAKDWWYNEIVPELPDHLQWIADIVDPDFAVASQGWEMNKYEMTIDDRTFVVEDCS